MTEFKISEFVVGLMVFSIALVGILVWASDLQSQQSASVPQFNTSFNQTMNKMESLRNLTAEIDSTVQGSPVETSSLLTTISNGAYSALKLSVASTKVFSSILEEAGTQLGVPPYVVFGLVAIVTVLVAFAIISGIFR